MRERGCFPTTNRVTRMRYQELCFSAFVLSAAIASNNCSHSPNMPLRHAGSTPRPLWPRLSHASAERAQAARVALASIQTMRGEGAVGPKFGPKQGGTRRNQALPGAFTGGATRRKSLHKMTGRYWPVWTPATFKTGASVRALRQPLQLRV